ncbi:MAG: glycogen debranching N-terminal domain-containing protein, partial [Pseudomonadota bacterium]
MTPQKSAAQLLPIETPSIETPSEGPFYIAATQVAGRPTRTLKYGDTFVVLDSRGDIAVASGRSAGLFHLDTRYLSRLELLVNGVPPLLLGSTLRDDNSALFADLTNPDLIVDQRIVLERDSVHILRTVFLWRGTAYQRLRVRNYGDHAINFPLSIVFANDFADLFEVRGTCRERRGSATARVHGDDQVVLSYHGLDAKLRRTTLNFDPPPQRLALDSAVYDLHIAPGETRPIFLAVSCDLGQSRPPLFLRGLVAARRESREAARHRTWVETSNDLFN